MNHLAKSNAESHEYYGGNVRVTEFNFPDDNTINDAQITLTGRYPVDGYAVNDVSLALITVEIGEGSITVKDTEALPLRPGDRLLVKPGEPYFLHTTEKLMIRYIATPAWTSEQSHIVESKS